MSELGELSQLNLRAPTELMGHMRALARDRGEKLHSYVLSVLLAGADRDLDAIGREAFMANLRAEHAAKEAWYEARFDELEKKL